MNKGTLETIRRHLKGALKAIDKELEQRSPTINTFEGSDIQSLDDESLFRAYVETFKGIWLKECHVVGFRKIVISEIEKRGLLRITRHDDLGITGDYYVTRYVISSGKEIHARTCSIEANEAMRPSVLRMNNEKSILSEAGLKEFAISAYNELQCNEVVLLAPEYK